MSRQCSCGAVAGQTTLFSSVPRASPRSAGLRIASPLIHTTSTRRIIDNDNAIAHRRCVTTHLFPLDQAWGTSIDVETLNQTLPQNLFAVSIIPYAGFLYHLTKSKQAPPLTLFGFYFLLVFVFGTIPAGIYAKKVYETSLANVDYLHGSAEFLLTMTNLFIVIGLRRAIREAESKNAAAAANSSTVALKSSSKKPRKSTQ